MEQLEGISREELKSQLEEIEHRISQIERKIDAKASRFEAYTDFAEEHQELEILEDRRKRLQGLIGD
jgi:hypothetical protein